MSLTRRSFLKGLAALPLVAAVLPKEVSASPTFSAGMQRKEIPGSDFVEYTEYWFSGGSMYIGSKEPLGPMRYKPFDESPFAKVEYWDGGHWKPVDK